MPECDAVWDGVRDNVVDSDNDTPLRVSVALPERDVESDTDRETDRVRVVDGDGEHAGFIGGAKG